MSDHLYAYDKVLSTLDLDQGSCYTMNIDTRLHMMMIERQADQLALSMNLCTLLGKQENYQLTNEIILEYVGLLSEKRLEDMLEYTTRELRAEV